MDEQNNTKKRRTKVVLTAEQMDAVKTPLKAIRAKCLDCCCGNVVEVRLCPSQMCALWAYRMGKRPKGCEDTAEDGLAECTQDSCGTESRECEEGGE